VPSELLEHTRVKKFRYYCFITYALHGNFVIPRTTASTAMEICLLVNLLTISLSAANLNSATNPPNEISSLSCCVASHTSLKVQISLFLSYPTAWILLFGILLKKTNECTCNITYGNILAHNSYVYFCDTSNNARAPALTFHSSAEMNLSMIKRAKIWLRAKNGKNINLHRNVLRFLCVFTFELFRIWCY